MSGWIKLHRTLTEWEWYDDHNATRLLVHLLVTVNYEDKKWQGILVKAGSIATSWESLSAKTGLTIRETRTAMQKLEKSGEATRQATNRWQVVSLVKWAEMQKDSKDSDEIDKQNDKLATIKRQASDNQTTTTKESNNLRSEESKKEETKKVDSTGIIIPDRPKPKRTIFIPPELIEVQNYCVERQNKVDPEQWHNHYTANGWMVGKTKMKDWKAAVRTWEKNNFNNQQNATTFTPKSRDEINRQTSLERRERLMARFSEESDSSDQTSRPNGNSQMDTVDTDWTTPD